VYLEVKKSDAAYVYQVLESYDGLVSHSTLAHQIGDEFRRIKLHIPIGQESDVEWLVQHLSKEIFLRRGIESEASSVS
jgi:hypothetical protein